MGYRKLTENEVTNLTGSNSKYAGRIGDVIKRYYQTPQAAVSAVISVTSEYDDERYENRVGYVGIYNSSGHEIYPIPGKDREARTALWDAAEDAFDSETEDSPDDVVVRLGVPELYVKE
jgi:hypothetical protein